MNHFRSLSNYWIKQVYFNLLPLSRNLVWHKVNQFPFKNVIEPLYMCVCMAKQRPLIIKSINSGL